MRRRARCDEVVVELTCDWRSDVAKERSFKELETATELAVRRDVCCVASQPSPFAPHLFSPGFKLTH